MHEYENRALPAPKWELLDTKGDDNHKLYHVKLSQPHIARLVDTGKFVEVNYVHVGVTHEVIKDSEGQFTYNETAITASDEAGKAFRGYLYMAHRALTLEESLFGIGEV